MKNILVTGANRGLGLQFVKKLSNDTETIFACCRQPTQAHELNALAHTHKNISVLPLDVREDKSIRALAASLGEKSIDMLINNAGTSGERGVTINNINKKNFMDVFETNCYGVVKTSEILLPLVEKSTDKLIVVMSSRMGSISDNDTGKSYAYRASKAALNAVMRSFAIDVKPRGVNVLLLHPGWVKTDMGGENGLIDVKESVDMMCEQIKIHGKVAQAEKLRRFDGETIDW